MTELPPLTLVLGGAASGKSAFAEALMLSSARPLVYIATAQAYDDEMTGKIATHQARRGADWQTLEEPLALAPLLAARTPDQAVLLDCATLWLTNHMMAEHDIAAETTALLQALSACPAPVIVVSNEVGTGGVPENALARRFQSAQGKLNQALAAQSDLVVQVIAGLPMVLKGTLPEMQS
jgi:adenosylcobinamide kinase / adenosylcobinamide-phosphate guanylyltransferase